jgi:hypothetical protein
MLNKKLIAALAVALLLFSMVAAGPALAAKSGHQHTTGTLSVSPLSVSPNPAPAGITEITLNGSGFAPNQHLGVGVYSYGAIHWIDADGSGNYTFLFQTLDGRQIYSDTAYVTDDAANLLATAPFTVCSTNPC